MVFGASLTPISTLPSSGYITTAAQQAGLSIDRYQELLNLPIAAFNGLNKPDEVPVYQCASIWRQRNRDNLARYLLIAEEKREQELGYYVAPKYIENEEYSVANPLILSKKNLIAIGKRTVTSIQSGYAITYRTGGVIIDPVIVTIPTSLTTTSGIYVCHSDDTPITPSSIVITGGNLVIKIPRSRLVKPELKDDREDPLQYDDDDNFVVTVDVKLTTYDADEGLKYVKFGTDFAEEVTDGKFLIKNYRLSIIEVNLEEILCSVSGFLDCSSSSNPIIRVSYVSGRQNSVMTEMQTLRLAHCLMPFEPCSCEAAHQYWRDDVTENPQNIITPYGNKSGAVEAWVADSRSKVGQGGKFPRIRG